MAEQHIQLTIISKAFLTQNVEVEDWKGHEDILLSTGTKSMPTVDWNKENLVKQLKKHNNKLKRKLQMYSTHIVHNISKQISLEKCHAES